MSDIKQIVVRISVMAAFMMLLLPVSANASISGQASFSYSDITMKSNTSKFSTTTFTETYMASMQKSFTRTISVTASSTWTKVTTDDGTGSKSNSEVSPAVSVSFNPPSLYTFKMGFHRTDTDSSSADHLTTTAATASFSTPQLGLVSPINLNFSRQRTFDHASQRRINDQTDTYGLNTGYKFSIRDYNANVSYGFNESKSEYFVSDLTGDTKLHNISGGVQKTFSKKFSANANASYSTFETVNTSKGLPSPFPVILQLNAGYSCPGAICGGPPYTTATLTAQPALVDNDIVTPAGINLNTADWHIGGGFVNATTVSMVRIYINTVPIEELSIINNTYNFNWSVLSSNDNLNWTVVPGPQTVMYDSVKNAFEISFADTTAIYFKAVNGAGQGAFNIDVTEFQVVGPTVATPTFKSVRTGDTQSFGFSLNYRPFETLTVSYGLNYSESNQDTKGEEKQPGNYSIGHNLASSYILHPKYLNAGLTLSLAESGRTNNTNVYESRGYGLSFASNPLPTVNSNLTLSGGEGYDDGKKSNTSRAVAFSLGLNLYPGVTLISGARISHNEMFQTVYKSTVDTFSYQNSLNLRPWSSVVVFVDSGHSELKIDSTKSSTDSLRVNISYRPIPVWIFGADFNIEPTSTQTYSLSLLPSRKLSLGASMSFTEIASTKSAYLSWYPLARVRVNLSYSSSSADAGVESEAVFASIAINL